MRSNTKISWRPNPRSRVFQSADKTTLQHSLSMKSPEPVRRTYRTLPVICGGEKLINHQLLGFKRDYARILNRSTKSHP